MDDHNFLSDKKLFKKMFRNATNEKHSFLSINYTNESSLYQDKNFNDLIGKCGGIKGINCKCDLTS